MEYSSPEKHQSQIYSAPSKDLLTQSLTGVFAAPQSHEVYAVPIQRYPHFTVPAAQNPTTGVIPETGASPGDESNSVPPANQDGKNIPPGDGSTGDLISEAWSLSCDMAQAWQTADQQASSKLSNETSFCENPLQDSGNVPTKADVEEKAPEVMQDRAMVDSQDDRTSAAEFTQGVINCEDKSSDIMQCSGEVELKNKAEKEGSLQESIAVPVSQQENPVSLADTQVEEDNMRKEVEVNTAHTTTDPRVDAEQVEQQLVKPAQSPEKIQRVEDKKSEKDNSDMSRSPEEVLTPESKRQRVKSGDSSNSNTPARLSDSSERPQRKRKLPPKLCDDSVIKDSRETSFILKEHSRSQMASKATPESKVSPDDAEAERLRQQRLKQFQRMYVMSQRGYLPEKPTDNITVQIEELPPDESPPQSPLSSSPRRTFSLMDIGISLNAKGEVTLSMPDDIKKLAKSGGSININFDIDCLDEDNCLKFKVTEDKEAITTALGVNENPEAPLIESEASSEPELIEPPQIKTELEDAPEPLESTNSIISNDVKPCRDSSVQVDLNVANSEEDYLNEKLIRASTATGFVSYPRFTQVTGSSLATVHKVLKNVKKGLSIDKLTKKPTWFCSLCNLTGDYGDMGPLFGPFDIYVPPKSSYRNKNMSEGAKNLFEKLSSTFNKDLTFSDESQITVEREEVWLHEDCICWSPGVYMIGFDIYGLEEIFKVARFTLCSECGEIGASLGCFKEGCCNRYHYRCAIKAKCKLIKTTFTVLCPTHSHGVVDNCLAVKPLMTVRNYLSQEEIDESEELLSRRPGDEAREFAVKITKTRIIRSRKSKKTKEKKRSVSGLGKKVVDKKDEDEGEEQVASRKRGRPRLYPRENPVKGVEDNSVREVEDEEEEEEEEDDRNQGDEEDNENRRATYECFGCSTLFIGFTSIRRHFKSYPSCRAPHIARCIDNDEDLPPGCRVCFSCGHYVKAGKMMSHLTNVPKRRCMEEHLRVIREVKGLNVQKYFAEDKKTEHQIRAKKVADGYDYNCFGCFKEFGSRKMLRVHLNCTAECRRKNLDYLIADDSEIPPEYRVCFGCGELVMKSTSMNLHFSQRLPRYDCKAAHDRVMRERRAQVSLSAGEIDLENEARVAHREEERRKKCNVPGEEDKEENEDDSGEEDDTAGLKLYCSHGHHRYAKTYNMNRHLRQIEDCVEPHIRGFLESGDRVPDGMLICINCGCYVMDRYREKKNHLERSGRDCAHHHFTAGGDGIVDAEKSEDRGEDMEAKGRQIENLEHTAGKDAVLKHSGKKDQQFQEDHYGGIDQNAISGRNLGQNNQRGMERQGDGVSSIEQEDVEMKDVEEIGEETKNLDHNNVSIKEEIVEEAKEVNVVKNVGESVRVKVEMITTTDQLNKDSSSSSSSSSPATVPPLVPSKSPGGDCYIRCSQCETKTKDRAYLKKHYRARHCPVGCGDYDLICTNCVKALKQIVTFPRGLEGYDYRSRQSSSKEVLSCPECSTVSKKHNPNYIRSHYREQHCKIGCAKYDQICTGCVAVLEKLTDWPKPLIGHDYSTGPPPVGFQCPKCKKGIDRQYFKRHYRHLHCKVHCIEMDGVCKKCFLVFKRMNMLSKHDGPGIDYRVK